MIIHISLSIINSQSIHSISSVKDRICLASFLPIATSSNRALSFSAILENITLSPHFFFLLRLAPTGGVGSA